MAHRCVLIKPVLKTRLLAALCSACVALPVVAQQADNQLRRSIDGTVPQTDNNLNGVEDSEETPPQPPVVFDNPINLDGTSNDANNGQNQPSNDDNNAQNQNAVPGALPANSFANGNAGNVNSTTGNQRAQRADRVGTIGEDGNITPLANTPAALVQGARRPADNDPFGPLGLRLGSFTLFTVVNQTVGYTSNADFAQDGVASGFSQTETQVRLQSNWPLHELRGQITGSFQNFFNDATGDLPQVNADASLRLDVSRSTTVTLAGRYGFTTEAPSTLDVVLPVGAELTGRPSVQTFGATAEVTHTMARLGLTLRGTVDRATFSEVEVNGAPNISQDDRNETLFQLTGRAQYETSVAFQPFIEASLGTRIFDERQDRNGNIRDSVLASLRGGVVVNLGEKLNGQLGVGYSTEVFDDSTIASLSGFTIDGEINWSPVRLTTITAAAQTSFSGSTEANENGSVTYAASLTLARDIRPNFTVNGRLAASIRDFDSTGQLNKTLQAEVGAEWRLNRTWAVLGRIGYENVDSTEAFESYDAFTGRITLRFQK